MKKVFTILATVLITATLWAQSPEKMSYQAVIRNASDNLITNQTVGMRISILKDSPFGTAVYVEAHSATTQANGLVSIEIGTGIVVSGNFTAIDWANGSYFIKTETDPTGGTNYTITGTSQLLSVPYALHAKTAESLSSSKHYIGELFGGGIVFWVDDTGEHGLIASLDDLAGSNGVAWSAVTNIEIGSTAQDMTNGRQNTEAMVQQNSTPGNAATLCNSYTNPNFGTGTFSDWYLPSNRELSILFSQDISINYVLDNDSNSSSSGLAHENVPPTNGRYWSSTENNSENAWGYHAGFGHAINSPKNTTMRVRAIRAF